MDTSPSAPITADRPIALERSRTERPLFLLVLITALILWVVICVSIVGLLYGVILGAIFLLTHVGFIAHLRGSALRLGPDQLPELHRRVGELATRAGLTPPPVAYVMQAGGTLNAMATKFMRSHFIVLYSELLDACGDNAEARDFIIAHELGHLRAGHLRWRWVLLPGLAVPFLGAAYSRACEYTCDRFGLAASRDPQRALDGLCILAAGPGHAPQVNRRALAAQRADLNTVWMHIGQWLATHPPIAHRLAALDGSLDPRPVKDPLPAIGAAALIGLAFIAPIVVGIRIVREVLPRFAAQHGAQQSAGVTDANGPAAVASARMASLAAAAELYRDAQREPPPDVDTLYAVWARLHPAEAEPVDPYGGRRFGYEAKATEYYIWSIGADADDEVDDLYWSSHSHRLQPVQDEEEADEE